MSTFPTQWFARASLVRWSFGILLLALAAIGANPARAQDDPPGRVGRLADLQGGVSWFDHETGAWTEAERNRPLTGGDRLSTAPQGRAELRVGSTVLRVAGNTELEVVRLDDERMVFELHTGSLALRVKTREAAAEIEVTTTEARLRPERAGHYRFDRVDDSTQAGVLRGTLRVDDAEGFILETGQRAELWRERRSLRFSWTQLPSDAFAEWVARDDQRDEQRTASNRYVSPEMTGAEDLDRDGRWERHPEYGAIWFPIQVQAGWAPYRYGRWAWVRPWGWTWVDDARWGFAPFHYGRWVSWGGRWGWCPGEYAARPVYAPALVAWVGGGNVSIGINIGGPTVGWVPLAPRDWYAPYYRHSPVYYDRVNRVPPGQPGWNRPPRSNGPVVWGNQAVPGAVTVVPRDVMVDRKPVWRGAVDNRDWHRGDGGRTPMPSVAPPTRDVQPPRMGPPSPGTIQQPQPQPNRGRDRDREPDRPNRPGWRGEAPAAPAVVMPANTEQQQALPPSQPAQPAVVQQPSPRERSNPGQRDRGGREPTQAPARPAMGPAAPPAAQVPPAPATPPAATPAAPPARPGPQAAPPAAPPAAAPPPRPPTSPPERAREREAERERAQEDRKRGPEGGRGPQRDREHEK